jgi:cytochrome c peroxidase
MKCKAVVLFLFLLTIGLGGVALADHPNVKLSPIEDLGKLIFFDKDLSINRNQACAACHAPEVGWTGPDSAINATGAVYEGSVPGRFGNRKPPASAYAGASPTLHQMEDGTWVGGMFWDGRATGLTLGDPLAEQAQGPFLNPLEQGLPSAADVVARVCDSSYAHLFKHVWGNGACIGDAVLDYERIARSIAAYERSKEVTAFTSKYDWYLKGKSHLTHQEKSGLDLFQGKAKCANCHVSKLGPKGELPLFTDYTYDNLGVPKNPLNPFYYEPQWNPMGPAWIDEGLGGFLRSIENPNYGTELGKFKVPTLRNVDLRVRPHHMVAGEPVKAYGHNGYFKSLKEIVHFYNTRDTLPTCVQGTPGEKITCWPEPELSTNMNTAEVGDLGLSEADEDAIVAFLKTLSDGYMH